jgi:hypothetical protein
MYPVITREITNTKLVDHSHIFVRFPNFKAADLTPILLSICLSWNIHIKFILRLEIIESSTFKCCELSTAQTGARGLRDVALFPYRPCTDSIKSSLQFSCNKSVFNASERSLFTRYFFFNQIAFFLKYGFQSELLFTIFFLKTLELTVYHYQIIFFIIGEEKILIFNYILIHES